MRSRRWIGSAIVLAASGIGRAEATSYAFHSLDESLAIEPVVMEGRVLTVACGNNTKGFPDPPPVRLGEYASTYLTLEVTEALKGVKVGDIVRYGLPGGCGHDDRLEDVAYDFYVGELWAFVADPNQLGTLRAFSPSVLFRQRLNAKGTPIAVDADLTPLRELAGSGMQQALVQSASDPSAPDLVAQISNGMKPENTRDLYEEDPMSLGLPWDAFMANLHAHLEIARKRPDWSDPGFVAPADLSK